MSREQEVQQRVELGPVETMRKQEAEVNAQLAEIRRAVHDGEWSLALSEIGGLARPLREITGEADEDLALRRRYECLTDAVDQFLEAEEFRGRPTHVADEAAAALYDARHDSEAPK